MLDEPTAHLDLGHQLEFFKLVRAATEARGVAAVAVLHDLNLAAQFCHRLWLVQAGDASGPGGLLAAGRPEAVLLPELVQRAFGLAVQVRHHPDSGLPYLLPVDGIARQTGGGPRVHVIAGGGAGERLIPILHRLGCELSVGAVNLLDSDHTLAARLGLDLVVEAPFSPVGEAARRQLAERLARARHVVVADVAWGSGNLPNLEALVASDTHARIWLVAAPDDERRDFTEGAAAALLARLQARGAERMPLDVLLDRFRGIMGSP
jgi:iron complex transport system ATP-binding protein